MVDRPSVPEAQIHLRLNSIREIFHHIDELSSERLDDRQIFFLVKDRMKGYSDCFLRWLVRHTLHPESEDDMMPDEVESEESKESGGEYLLLHVKFSTIPPTVKLHHLIQYRQQFWHAISVDYDTRYVILRPLSSYEL